MYKREKSKFSFCNVVDNARIVNYKNEMDARWFEFMDNELKEYTRE